MGQLSIPEGVCGQTTLRLTDGARNSPRIAFVEVTIRLFAVLRERAGAREVTLELPDGARVADAIGALREIAEGCRW